MTGQILNGCVVAAIGAVGMSAAAQRHMIARATQVADVQPVLQVMQMRPVALVPAFATLASISRGNSGDGRFPDPSSGATDPDEGQEDDHLFDGTERFAKNAKESSEVNLDKNMLDLAGKKNGDNAGLARKMDFVVVRSYEYANEGDYRMADVEQYFKKLDAAGWKHLVRTRSGKENTDICVKQDAEGVTREMVIISAEPKELSFVHLKGNISMTDLARYGGGSAAATALRYR